MIWERQGERTNMTKEKRQIIHMERMVWNAWRMTSSFFAPRRWTPPKERIQIKVIRSM